MVTLDNSGHSCAKKCSPMFSMGTYGNHVAKRFEWKTIPKGSAILFNVYFLGTKMYSLNSRT